MKTKTVTLTDSEWKVLDIFLGELRNYQTNACCNDLPQNIVDLWTPEEGVQCAMDYAYYNNPIEPEGPNWPISDFCLLSLIRSKIKKQTNN